MRSTMDMRERIRAEMSAQGLNPKSLAKKAGLNETYVRDLLEGRSQDPKLSKVLALAQALGKSLSWLIEGVEAAEFEALIRRLPARDRAEVIDFARFKADKTGDES